MIKKYTKRPVTVEGIAWDGTQASSAEIQMWVGHVDGDDRLDCKFLPAAEVAGHCSSAAIVWDDVQRGWVPVNVGDVILKGVRGEFYPIHQDVLAATYRAPLADLYPDALIYLMTELQLQMEAAHQAYRDRVGVVLPDGSRYSDLQALQQDAERMSADRRRALGWVEFVTHVDSPGVTLEFADPDEGGTPRWERSTTRLDGKQ